MSPSDHPFRLWIASDDEQVVVALCPLRISGEQLKHEWGNLTDLRVLPPLPRSSGADGLPVATLLAVSLGGALCFSGAPPMVALILAGLAALVVYARSLRKDLPGRVVAPGLKKYPDIHRVLDAPEEREDFLDLVELAERVGQVLPALNGMVDPADSAKALAQALWDGADILNRRKELRSVVEGLKRHDHAGLSEASRAVQYLAAQRTKASDLLEQVDAELARLAANLEAAAIAGENFSREQELLDAALQAEETLVGLASQELIAGSDASEQLAEETSAVLDAYRELNELYGGKH